jgi:hypothetical protein
LKGRICKCQPVRRKSSRRATDDTSKASLKELVQSGDDQQNFSSESDDLDPNEARLEVILPQDESVGERKTARNVGGWQKPAFATLVDRTWIAKNCGGSNFDPSFYVPQVGDLVL